MFNRKQKKIISSIIIIVVVLAMVLPLNFHCSSGDTFRGSISERLVYFNINFSCGQFRVKERYGFS